MALFARLDINFEHDEEIGKYGAFSWIVGNTAHWASPKAPHMRPSTAA